MTDEKAFIHASGLNYGCLIGSLRRRGLRRTAGKPTRQQQLFCQPAAHACRTDTMPDSSQEPSKGNANSTLVAYFSATGNTEEIAQHLQTILGASLYEIIPAKPYSDDDLDYNASDCRANQEQNDPSVRPAIDGSVENMDSYDVILLGYPIWWGEAPRIISTFLESYDFTGKTIVPFCTSGSSSIGGSAEHLTVLAADATWLEGARFNPGATQDEVAAWVEGLGV